MVAQLVRERLARRGGELGDGEGVIKELLRKSAQQPSKEGVRVIDLYMLGLIEYPAGRAVGIEIPVDGVGDAVVFYFKRAAVCRIAVPGKIPGIAAVLRHTGPALVETEEHSPYEGVKRAFAALVRSIDEMKAAAKGQAHILKAAEAVYMKSVYLQLKSSINARRPYSMAFFRFSSEMSVIWSCLMKWPMMSFLCS